MGNAAGAEKEFAKTRELHQQVEKP
jgi:hypothetical protein